MAKRKLYDTPEDTVEIESPEDVRTLKVQFKKIATGSYGHFTVGSVVELPAVLALSFIAEGAAERV